tara:strand:- start:303 stop:551 length:249 start_codon:yes stop_codon:yes gene_type:complete
MAKQLDKDMMRMMSITERFKYQNDLKRMRFNMSEIKKEQEEVKSKYTQSNEPWIDEDRSEYDDFSDGGDRNDSGNGDDSNEY